MTDKDTYFVALKLFLRKGDAFLILKDNFGDWDLPGGRIKPHEFETPLEDILRRKIREELGDAVKVTLGKMPVVLMRHERIEQTEERPVVRIFGLGYESALEAGDIQLSTRHTEMLWVDAKTFKADQYFTGGWLQGVRDYMALRS